MNDYIKIISKNLEDTEKIAQKIVNELKRFGGLICLYGDIGAGKTAFTSMCAKSIGVKEKVTSPSFVILNEYYSGEIPIYHFDLYRLENEGLSSILDELRTYSQQKNSLAFVEWAEFSANELDFKRLEIFIKYIDENQREFTIKNCGIFTNKEFEKIKKDI